MSFESFIAKRLRFTPSATQRRSPAVAIAIAGVALAVAIMIATLSIVLGFQNSIRNKVLGFEPAIQLHPLGKYYAEESPEIYLSQELQTVISQAIPNATVSLQLSQPVVLKTPDNFVGLTISAFDDAHDFDFQESNMIEGKYPTADNELAISKQTAGKLGLKVGDKVDGCFFINNSLKLRRLVISGIFSSNFGDFDKITAYSSFSTIKKLRKLPSGYGDAIDINNIPLEQLPEDAATLHLALQQSYNAGTLSDGLSMTTVLETGVAYLSWLDMLDANTVVILVIMILVSGFTLISCVFILILQRVKMIGVLKAMGCTNRQIRNIFLLLGGRIVAFGLTIGNIIAIGLLFLQSELHFMKLNPDSYYLDSVPVELTWGNILAVNIGAVIICFLLMLIPVAMISRLSPSKTIRFE